MAVRQSRRCLRYRRETEGEKRAGSLGIVTGASVLIYLVLQVDGEVRLQRLVSDPVCESGTKKRQGSSSEGWRFTRRANSLRLFGLFIVYNLVNLRYVIKVRGGPPTG